MSSGPKNVTSTTNTEPPDFIKGPLQTAVNAAQSQFTGSTGYQPTQTGAYGGNRLGGRILGGRGLAGQDGQTPGLFGPGAAGGIIGGAAGQGAGSSLIGQSQGLVSDTLAGNFLNSNPYLDQTFNRAADLTRTRLSSEFAGSGRDLGAAAPARSDELQTLASNIYGNNYQAERDRQTSAIGDAQQLDPLNRFINQLAGVIPGAGGSTQSTQPVYRTGLFSDRRLKKNIQRIGMKNGYNWYSFEYAWGEKSEGVMADEIPPEFVFTRMGFSCVDYDALGVK